ncbi:MAG: type II CAAX endopeptidase family protein [Candidatus Micrarchaeota archaeon]|nr:type II CAAX endopeptidase family protein [Candidatus Micrarchaeota archaeon]
MKLLFPLSILILLILSVFIFPFDQFGSSVFYVSLAFIACALFLSSWNTDVLHGLTYLRLTPRWKGAPAIALQSLALFAACAAVTLAISGIFMLAGALDTDNVYGKVSLLPLPALILAFTLAPLGEEMFFRGFLFRWMGEKLGGWLRGKPQWAAGALLSSLVFALMHAPYGSVAEVAVAFAVGLALCAGVKRTGSLVPAVLAHAAFNLASIAMAVFI